MMDGPVALSYCYKNWFKESGKIKERKIECDLRTRRLIHDSQMSFDTLSTHLFSSPSHSQDVGMRERGGKMEGHK